MKIFGGGLLRDKVDECLQYVLKQEYVLAFTIGQENQDEMAINPLGIPPKNAIFSVQFWGGEEE
jgi:hypothetical protein